MSRRRPRSLLTQVALLSFAALLVAQFVSFWLFTVDRAKRIRVAQRIEVVERVTAVAALLNKTPATARDDLLEAASSRSTRFDLATAPIVDDPVDLLGADCGQRDCADLGLPPGLRMQEDFVSRHDGGRFSDPPPRFRDRLMKSSLAPVAFKLSLPLRDAQWLNVTSRFERPAIQLPPQVMGTTLVSLALVLAALWFALRRITRPLDQLASVADGFGLDTPPPRMPTGGPREVRALSDALARMHERLSRMLGERTRMLAALGHDLRSPITALRVRAEMVDDAENKERMIATLDEMQQMVEATLAFARGVSTDQPTEPVDLAALLSELAAELSAIGPPIRISSAKPIVLPLRRVPLRRALRNILENAQRYGGGAEVRIEHDGTDARVVIEDHGPGLPDNDLTRVFEPFVRLETSRSRETGGTGLGLPIARAILQAHGASIALTNRPEGGLRATVTFAR
ncbi:ATP-binding protein [Rhodopseudomonas palustris]|uniref:ATP-binding protein n=1 Tax=Rhodopseudomonas palustris TaxID=1076 RepID=UPI002ACD7044|nr:ATP-binding protein [Rhodopseudomonas palustris]WQH01189.1 ATP-binding protein [Rhodopseudomonas palustris]